MTTLVADPKVQENPRDLQTLCVWGCLWEGHGWVFPFSLLRFLNKKSSLDNCGNYLGSLQGLVLLPGLISASFLGPVSYLISVTIASGRPTVCLCALWPGALMKARSHTLEDQGSFPQRTALQRNIQGNIASPVPRDRQLRLCLWA